MASIKQLSERKYKITISNGYRNGKKICKSQTIQVPKSVASRSIRQYVMHEAEELERRFKYGFSEDGSTTFQDYAEGSPEQIRTQYAGFLSPPVGGGLSLYRCYPPVQAASAGD